MISTFVYEPYPVVYLINPAVSQDLGQLHDLADYDEPHPQSSARVPRHQKRI